MTLSNAAGVVATTPTPLKVTHAVNCAAEQPTLSLQLNTVALGSLTVNGINVGASLTALGCDGAGCSPPTPSPPPSPPPPSPPPTWSYRGAKWCGKATGATYAYFQRCNGNSDAAHSVDACKTRCATTTGCVGFSLLINSACSMHFLGDFSTCASGNWHSGALLTSCAALTMHGTDPVAAPGGCYAKC